MKTLISACLLSIGLIAAPAFAASHAGGGDAMATCEKSAADKKLAGAAKTSHIKKCMSDTGGGGDAQAMCDKSAADKKLAGAAKTSHVKKCMSDAAAAKK
jgi:hypothetical protein